MEEVICISNLLLLLSVSKRGVEWPVHEIQKLRCEGMNEHDMKFDKKETGKRVKKIKVRQKACVSVCIYIYTHT